VYELIQKAAGGRSPAELSYEDVATILVEYRETREVLRKQLFKVEELLAQIEQWFLDRFGADGLDGVKITSLGLHLLANERDVFEVKDWDAFASWVLDQQSLDYVQRRASVTALRDFYATTGNLPPGVARGVRTELSVRTTRKGRTNGE
jgi:hypothetical protein